MNKNGKTIIGAVAGAGIGEGIAIIKQKLDNSPVNPVPFIAGGALIGGALAYFLWK
jgi:hypothetical protein